ncbi:hypothetical protein ACO1KB_15880 [Leptospira interrogans serovar Szwajizak]|uniref:hypothetical protein n=1 Tax=Leptospira interrogans TaxID=173 RepID=UPI000348DB78|nr:hypothetical protein [Leptospira interrogans]
MFFSPLQNLDPERIPLGINFKRNFFSEIPYVASKILLLETIYTKYRTERWKEINFFSEIIKKINFLLKIKINFEAYLIEQSIH